MRDIPKKLISKSNRAKSGLSISYILFPQSFSNFAQSRAVSLPYSVQNLRTIELTKSKLWTNEISRDLSLRWVSLRNPILLAPAVSFFNLSVQVETMHPIYSDNHNIIHIKLRNAPIRSWDIKLSFPKFYKCMKVFVWINMHIFPWLERLSEHRGIVFTNPFFHFSLIPTQPLPCKRCPVYLGTVKRSHMSKKQTINIYYITTSCLVLECGNILCTSIFFETQTINSGEQFHEWIKNSIKKIHMRFSFRHSIRWKFRSCYNTATIPINYVKFV